MTVIWTGFEPFGDHAYNPSWDVARAAAEMGEDWRAEELPVTFAEAVARADRLREGRSEDDLSVHVGLGASRDHVCLEAVARNATEGRADNAGEAPEGELVCGGTAELRTELDLAGWRERLEAPLRDAGLPDVRISEDCGLYVCNALYYRVLQHSHRAVFVHVPMMDQGAARELGEVLGTIPPLRRGEVAEA